MADSSVLYPTPSKDDLRRLFVGKTLQELPTPSAVLDLALVRRNCERMLSACTSLGLGWRAHIKTHKTVEITGFQVGSSPNVKIVVSTMSEADPGRTVDVLYGLPISRVPWARLAKVGLSLGKGGSISILLDHPDQLHAIDGPEEAVLVPNAYIKIDMGGKRAGVRVGSDSLNSVIEATCRAHNSGRIVLKGLYSHAGHSYGGNSRAEAVKMLGQEISALMEAAEAIRETSRQRIGNLTLSVGASPTALAIQNLLGKGARDMDGAEASDGLVDATRDVASLLERVRQAGHEVEIHAGVYATPDLQQLAAHSIDRSLLSWDDLSMTILAEVVSAYPGRGGSNGRSDDYLIGAGGFVLGREACKAYAGLAMVTPWGREARGLALPQCNVDEFEGWVVDRFSQEHGILAWKSAAEPAQGADALDIGQKIRLWPNHACFAGAHFGWYFVVDSEGEEKDQVVDVWPRTRGR